MAGQKILFSLNWNSLIVIIEKNEGKKKENDGYKLFWKDLLLEIINCKNERQINNERSNKIFYSRMMILISCKKHHNFNKKDKLKRIVILITV